MKAGSIALVALFAMAASIPLLVSACTGGSGLRVVKTTVAPKPSASASASASGSASPAPDRAGLRANAATAIATSKRWLAAMAMKTAAPEAVAALYADNAALSQGGVTFNVNAKKTRQTREQARIDKVQEIETLERRTIADAKGVVVEWVRTIRRCSPTNGRTVSFYGADYLEVDPNGLIVVDDEYFDAATIERLCAGRSSPASLPLDLTKSSVELTAAQRVARLSGITSAWPFVPATSVPPGLAATKVLDVADVTEPQPKTPAVPAGSFQHEFDRWKKAFGPVAWVPGRSVAEDMVVAIEFELAHQTTALSDAPALFGAQPGHHNVHGLVVIELTPTGAPGNRTVYYDNHELIQDAP